MAAVGTTIELYTYSGDPRTVNKDNLLKSKATVTAYLNNPCDILSPSFSMPYDSNYLAYNYAKIPSWGNRSYFITNYTTDKGGKLYLHLSIDVLNTYHSGINQCQGTVVRFQQYKGSGGINYVIDEKLPIHPDLCDINIQPLRGGTPWKAASGAGKYTYLLGVI